MKGTGDEPLPETSPRVARWRPCGPFPYLSATRPLAFAHRGGAHHGDENTVAAFGRAVGMGYRYLEIDVRCTADDVAVVFHDELLDRVAGTPGELATLRWEDLRTVRIGGEQAVPRLEDVLTAWPDTRFNIDVKCDAAVVPVVSAVRRTDSMDRVLVAAFSDARIRRIRRILGPRLATALGPREALRLRTGAWLGRGMWGLTPGVPAAQIPARAGLVTVVDEGFIRYAHRLGVHVHVWTIDDPMEMHRLLDLGVDGIMTDRIDVLRDVYSTRGLWAA